MDCCIKEKEIATLQSENRTILKRLDEHLTLTKAVYQLAAEMKVMNKSIENLTKGQEKLTRDVDELKMKPARRWDSLVIALLTALVSGITGYMIAQVFK